MIDGYMDLVTETSHRDTCLVLPTLLHAVNIWPIVRTMFSECHNELDVATTKTAIICKDTMTVMKLWVPYGLDPTMPMDYPHAFAGHCLYMSVWYTRRELKPIVADRRTSFSIRERRDIEASRAIYKRAGRRA